MKRLFSTLLLVFAGIALYAQGGARSVLRFKLSDDSRLAVSIDNRYYDKQGRSITVGDLPAGRHYIKIYKYMPYNDARGGKAREVYRGGIRISSGTITNFTYDMRDGKLYANTEFLDGSYRDDNDGRNDHDAYGRDRRDDHRRSDDMYYTRNWTDDDMRDLKKRVEERITDSDKLKLIQSVLKDRRYTTEQMRSMINWLSFDDSKVNLAKWGYDFVSDRQNYWKLESEFTFSGSKDDFNTYINGRK